MTSSTSVSVDDAERLLLAAQASSPFLTSLTEEDVAILAEQLPIVGYQSGKVVMAAGESASWAAIVLSGGLTAHGDANDEEVLAHLGTSTIIG